MEDFEIDAEDVADEPEASTSEAEPQSETTPESSEVNWRPAWGAGAATKLRRALSSHIMLAHTSEVSASVTLSMPAISPQ